MASSAACECAAEEQTVDHAVLQCPIHRPPHGLHGLTVLDDETIDRLLNNCPRSSAAKQCIVTTCSNDEEEEVNVHQISFVPSECASKQPEEMYGNYRTTQRAALLTPLCWSRGFRVKDLN